MDAKPTYHELEKKIRQLEQELQKGEADYRILLDESSDPIFSFYPDGTYRFVNHAFAQGVGKSVDEIVGHRIWDIFPGEEGDKRFSVVKHVFATGEPKTVEVRVPKPEGDHYYITTVKAIKDHHGKAISVICSSKNITDRIRAEETLRESEERHRLFFENAPIGIIHYSNKGIITAVNEAVITTFGSSREKLIGLDIDKIPDKKFAKEVYRSLNSKPGYFEGEYSSHTGTKTSYIKAIWIPIKRKGEILAGVGIVEDITAGKRAEEALNSEKERLAVTLRSIADAVIATDRSGRVTLMNPIAEHLTGWPESEAKGRPLPEVFTIVNEMTGQPSPNPVQRVLETDAIQGLSNHTVLISRNGNRYSIADSAAPIMDAGQTVVGVVLVFRDVTAAQRTEAELLKMEKLQSLGVLAGGIAHDFNNFLTGIIGNLSLARLDLDPADRIFPRLNEMEKAALRAKDLTQQLLTFSKGGEPIKVNTPMDVLVREAALFALRGSNVRCRFDFADDLWPAHVDAGQIGQVIHNLAINADQVMPEGGTISIRGQNCVVESGSHLKLAPGRYIRIVVLDQGTGIKKEHLARIFDPYFTTKQKGSGLGLAIVYSIIEKHGGQVSVNSELGVGSTFNIYLPASADNAVQAATPEAPMVSGSGRILVMDDEPFIRTLAAQMLKKMGYQTTSAQDGTEAIEIYRQAMVSAQPFDAVILDLTVPGGMGGRETLIRLTAIDKDVKAIVSSGYSNDPVMSNFKDYGFLSAVRKPYVISELSDALKTLG